MENFYKHIWSKMTIHKPPVDLWNKIENALDVKAVPNNIASSSENIATPIQNKYLRYIYFSGTALTIGILCYFIFNNNKTIDKVSTNVIKQKNISAITNNNNGTPKNENKAEALANKSDIDNIDLTKGLIAWYPFNGNANDLSGNKNNGIIHDAILTADRFGNPNSAYYFDGYDSYIEVANSASLNPTKAISLCAWYKPEPFSNDGSTGIIDKGFTSDNPPYYQYRFASPGEYGYNSATQDMFSYGVAINNAQSGFNTPNYFYTVGNWYFLTGTYDGTTLKFYVNDVLIDSSLVSGSLNGYNSPLYIGRNSIDPTGLLKGTVDDIRIYNRAITVREIDKLFHDLPLVGKKEKITSIPIKISVKQNYIKNELTIVSNSDINKNIKVINFKGETIYQATMNKTAILDISGYLKGVYKLKLTTDKETHVEIFVKQ